MRIGWIVAGVVALAGGSAGVIAYLLTNPADDAAVVSGCDVLPVSQPETVVSACAIKGNGADADFALARSGLAKDASADGKKDGQSQEAASAPGDEALMDEVVSGLLDMLQDAVRRKDYAALARIANKLRSVNYGSLAGGRGSGTSAVKRRILELAGDAGIGGLALAMDFLGDEDPGIVETAEQIMFRQLNDSKLSDYARAEVVVEAAQEMSDSDSLNRLFNEFIKMRHSVGASALQQIASSGTDQAKEQLPRVMQAFTGDSSILTAGELAEWLEGHPDSYMDDWFYGRETLESVREKQSN